MYGIVITEKGLALDAKLRAGDNLRLTRVMVGDGTVPEETNPRKLTDLISPFAEATSTPPVAVGASTKLVVEYRNDMNGGLSRNRNINEYGLFAQDPEDGEILYLYGNLGEFPEPIRAHNDNEPVSTRRYPVSITVADGIDVVLGYQPSVFVTVEEALAIIDDHNADQKAHQDLRMELSGLRTALSDADQTAQTAQQAASAAANIAADARAAADAAAKAAQKIALSGAAIQTGYYIGDGTAHTADNPKSIVFNLKPKVVLLLAKYYNNASVQSLGWSAQWDYITGNSEPAVYVLTPDIVHLRTHNYGVDNYYDVDLLWSENSLGWYAIPGSTALSDNGKAVRNFNKAGLAYYWIAFGTREEGAE